MTENYYDAVVLGRSIGALSAAALLARRDFRVLVLGQGQLPPTYRFGRHVLHRAAFTLLAGSTPSWRKILLELAQTQTFRRRAEALDPMVQVLLPDQRFELPPDMRLFQGEVDREFPGLRRVLEELFSELGRTNAAADAAFEKDTIWPPGTFWERRKAARWVSTLPYARTPGFDLLGGLPPVHAYRQLAVALVGFGSDLALDRLPTFAFARLHGDWTRGPVALGRGEQELFEFLTERIQAHGGACRLADRAARILVDARGARAVLLDGDAFPTGAGFVLSDGTGEGIAALSEGAGILKSAEREWPRLTRAFGRFVLTIVARAEGLPERLGREAIVIPSGAGLPLHVVRMGSEENPEEQTLVVEALIPLDSSSGGSTGSASLPANEAEASSGVAGAREGILGSLVEAFPFLERHLLVVDSPHDGRPVWVYDATPGESSVPPRCVERVELSGGTLLREPMRCQWRVEPSSYLGWAGESLRGPVGRTFLVGSTVLPALGQEGELIAALGATGIITRADRHKERIRRAMWTRVEIG